MGVKLIDTDSSPWLEGNLSFGSIQLISESIKTRKSFEDSKITLFGWHLDEADRGRSIGDPTNPTFFAVWDLNPGYDFGFLAGQFNYFCVADRKSRDRFWDGESPIQVFDWDLKLDLLCADRRKCGHLAKDVQREVKRRKSLSGQIRKLVGEPKIRYIH